MPSPEPDRTAHPATFPEPTADHVPTGETSARAKDTSAPDSHPTPGTSGRPDVPGYEILGELGRGGMGIVYKARHAKLNRLVALKMVLGGEQVGRNELIRFLAEAEAVAAVRHANVVQVHEYGEAGGRPYMALEFLPGGSLSRRLADDRGVVRSPSSARAAARLVGRIARGVAAAHELGIVHRDLKPANILFDEDGEPKVADFGLAKRGLGSDVTATGTVMGTPAYMSPEQAKGETKFVGPQADVWALGVILYECLTGERPFTGTVQEILAGVQNADPLPPRRLAPAVPRDLELICLKCLSKQPYERYPTAAELADDLDRFTRGEPIGVRPAGPLERGYKWARRNKAATAALFATAAGAAVLGVLLATLSRNTDLDRQRKSEGELREMAEGLREKADADRDEEARLRKDADAKKAQEAELRKEAERGKAEEHQRLRDARYFAQLIRTSGSVKKDPHGGLKLLREAACPEDLREVTWRVLHRLCHPAYLTLKDQPGSVLAVSPDSRTLAVGGAGAKPVIRLLDIETGRERRSLTGHAAAVTALAYSADGQTLVSASMDGTVRLWNPTDGEPRRTVGGPTGGVQSVAISPDGRWLAASGAGNPFADKRPTPVKFWDLQAAGGPSELVGHDGLVSALAFSPDGKTLASASADGTVRLWETPQNRPRATLKHDGWVTSVAFDSEGKTLAAGTANGIVKVWAESGEELRSWSGQAAGIYALAFSPDGKVLATAHEGGSATANHVKLWNPKAGTELFALEVAKSRPVSLKFSPNGKTLAAADEARTVTLWRVNQPEEAVAVQSHLAGYAVTYSPSGDTIATGGGMLSISGEVRLWDAKTGEPDRVLGGHKARVLAVAFSPSGDILASGAADGSVKLWNPKTGAGRGSVAGHTGEVRCIAFAHNRSLGASGGLDRDVRVWDPADGRELFRLKGHENGVMAAAFSPDDTILATAGHDNTVRLWDTATGRPVGKWESGANGAAGRVLGLAFSPDGKELYTGENSAVRVRSVADGKVLRSNPGHPNLFTLALSRNGRTLATGGSDGAVKLWDAAGLRDVLTLSAGSAQVKCVAFSPDGLALAGIGTDGKLRIWR